MIVVDASALVEVLIRSDLGIQVTRRLEEWADAIHAPALIDVEVSHTLRRLSKEGRIESTSAGRAIEDLADFPLTRWDHRALLRGAWALRNNISSYDAMYVALAASLDAPLLTFDDRLIRVIADLKTIEVTSLS